MKRYKRLKGFLDSCKRYALLGMHEQATKAELDFHRGMQRLTRNVEVLVADPETAVRAIVVAEDYETVFLTLTSGLHGKGIVCVISLASDPPTIECAYHDRLRAFTMPDHSAASPGEQMKKALLSWLNTSS